MNIINRCAIILGSVILLSAGCKKLVTVDAPVTSTNSSNVYNSDATAAAVLTGIYTEMSQSDFPGGGLTSASLFLGLSADELSLYGTQNAVYDEYYQNRLNGTSLGSSDFWSNIYPMLYVINAAIAGLNTSSGLTPAVKQQLLGEAYFMRGFCYFYLVNLYGDVPLVTGTNYVTNESMARTPADEVWAQIVADLKQAQIFLSGDYLESDANTPYAAGAIQRIRPTKWAADALLARTYLYEKDYTDANSMADSVINNTAVYSLVNNLDSVFLANSNEAIWQLQPVFFGENTQDALLFVLPASGPSGTGNPVFPVYLSPFLVNSFEPGDHRRYNWVDSVMVNATTYYYPYKYKVDSIGAPVTEYTMVFRLGEQYLIRAEAEANGAGSGIGSAVIDLNAIRTRAGLQPYAGSQSKVSVLAAIYHERQVELFTEWGHRWLDLKRTNTIDAVLGPPGGVCAAKGGVWSTNWQWYPIQLTELQHDPNLIQNSGY